jgi:hypothetical protein
VLELKGSVLSISLVAVYLYDKTDKGNTAKVNALTAALNLKNHHD